MAKPHALLSIVPSQLRWTWRAAASFAGRDRLSRSSTSRWWKAAAAHPALRLSASPWEEGRLVLRGHPSDSPAGLHPALAFKAVVPFSDFVQAVGRGDSLRAADLGHAASRPAPVSSGCV